MLVIIITAYFITLILLGISQRKISSIHEFILAGKNMTLPVLTATIVTTFYGATAILGGAELSFYFGLGALWFMVPFYLGNLLVVFFLGKIKDSNAETLPDFLGEYYGSRTVVASAILLTFLCLVPASLIAGGKIMHVIHPVSAEFWMCAVTLVVVAYTMMGGMRAVAISDAFQFALVLTALIILLPYAFELTPNFIDLTPPENLTPFTYSSMFPQDAVRWTILLFFLPITSAPLYQRLFASSSNLDRRKAIIASIIVFFAVDAIVMASGMIASINAETLGLSEENADIAFIILGYSILPGALKALFTLGILAAIMSTADSWIHSGASSLSYDVLGRLKPMSDEQMIYASRLFVVLLGFASLVLALYFQDVLAALVFLLTVWVAGILIPTVTALAGKKIKERSAIASIAAGGIASIIWGLHPFVPIDPLFIGLLAAALATVTSELF